LLCVVTALVILLPCVYIRFCKITERGLGGSDTVYYTNIAKAWSDGEITYQIDSGISVYRPVVFFCYSVAIRILGYSDHAIKSFNASIGVASTFLIFLVCYFLSEKGRYQALAAALIYAFAPMAIYLSRTELVHVLSGFLLLISFLFFLFYYRSARNSRYSFLVASGLFTGLAALTHEELLFIWLGYIVFLFADLVLWSRERSTRSVLVDAGIFSAAVTLVSHRMVAINYGILHRKWTDAIGVAATGDHLERIWTYLEKLLKFTWVALSGNGSNLMMYLIALLLLYATVAAARRILVVKKPSNETPPLYRLPIVLVSVYMICYSYFFSTIFPRVFFPIFPLVIISVIVWYSRALRRRFGPWIANTTVACIAIAVTIFSLGHHVDRLNRFSISSKARIPMAVPLDLDLICGNFSRFVSVSYKKNWERSRYEELKDKVSENARLLVTSSIIYPYQGRRPLQVGYYFGDNAIYAIDHNEPLDELISKYKIKYILFTLHTNDLRVLDYKEFRKYQYGGKWSELEPLVLGASYGFEPGRYTTFDEFRFLDEYCRNRGAKVLHATGHYRKPDRPWRKPWPNAHIVWEL
jgi:4-amino-4-deoxy-L-arabinose transferase-like glycosyltransferase